MKGEDRMLGCSIWIERVTGRSMRSRGKVRGVREERCDEMELSEVTGWYSTIYHLQSV
jgi:hypothetical protein